MAQDLEDFLKRAAERLAEKVNQAGSPPPRTASPPKTPRSIREAERQLRQAEIVEAEIIEDEAGPNPLSNLDTRYSRATRSPQRPALSSGVDQADERMTSHLHEALDHDVVRLRDASRTLGGISQNAADSGRTSVTRRNLQTSTLITMLRNPETLRAAFIAGEIFKRPS